MAQRLQSLGIELPRFELFPNVSQQMGGAQCDRGLGQRIAL